MIKLKRTHDISLHLLDELAETESASLRAELQVLYGTLVSQLEEADATRRSYELVADQIRSKASVHKRRLAYRMMEEVPD